MSKETTAPAGVAHLRPLIEMVSSHYPSTRWEFVEMADSVAAQAGNLQWGLIAARGRLTAYLKTLCDGVGIGITCTAAEPGESLTQMLAIADALAEAGNPAFAPLLYPVPVGVSSLTVPKVSA